MSSEGNVSGVVVDTPEVSKSITGVSVDSEQKVMVEGNLNTTDNQLTVDYKPASVDAVNDVESKQAPSINLEETNENESQKESLSPEGSDSIIILCIFWNSSGYGSASETITKLK